MLGNKSKNILPNGGEQWWWIQWEKVKNHLKQIQEYDTNTLPETNMT